MKVFSSAANRRRAILGLVGIVVLFVGLYFGTRQYAPFLFDSAELRRWIDQFGVFAPVVFILLQAGQVVLAPIPGQVVAFVAGVLFGSFAGTVYSMIGVVVGSAIAFSISKRYGRSAVERLLKDDLIGGFDDFVERVGLPGLFVFVVIPGLPDDAVCFLAGLTTFKLRTFLVVIAVGRLPAYVLTVYAGGSVAADRFLEAGVAIALVVSFALLGYYKRDEIKRRVGEM